MISLGGGRVVATDYPQYGVIGVCTIDDRERQIGRPYLGWTSSIFDYPIDYDASSLAGSEDDMPLNDADKTWLNGLGSAIIGQVRDAVGDKAWLNGLGSSIIDQTSERVARDLPGLVWAEPVQAQDSDGLLLTHPDGSPITVPASGYPASTNAQVHALREAVRILALGQGADPAAIEEAAMNGARRALERLTLTAKTD